MLHFEDPVVNRIGGLEAPSWERANGMILVFVFRRGTIYTRIMRNRTQLGNSKSEGW